MSELALKLIEREKKEKTGNLDLGNCGLHEIPEEVFELTWLESLNFCSQSIDYRTGSIVQCFNNGKPNYFQIPRLPNKLSNLSKLKKLLIGGYYTDNWKVNNIRVVEELKNLEYLDVSFCKISSVDFLKKLKKLQVIDLSFNKLSSVIFLTDLTQVLALNLTANSITDTSWLERMSRLVVLFIGQNQIKSLNLQKELPSLKSLVISHNKIANIEFLKYLPELVLLRASYNKILESSPFSKLKKIEVLELNGCDLSNVDFLRHLPQLLELDLSQNSVIDLSPLNELRDIGKLEVRVCELRDLNFLKGMKKLKSLALNLDLEVDLTPLKGLSDLINLDVSCGTAIDMSFVEAYKNLEVVSVRGRVINLEFLGKCKKVRKMQLSLPETRDISFIKNMTNLEDLNLMGSQISDISFLADLTNLSILNLINNHICDITALRKLKNLKNLALSNNSIGDISPLLTLIQNGLKVSFKYWGEHGIHLGQNPLFNPPQSIIREGNEAIISWFKQMEHGEEPLYEGKIMILGQGGAGKTTLANLLIDPGFELQVEEGAATLGIVIHKDREFSHQNIEDRTIKAHLWDFGGQDIQKMLHQFFITENCQYILVSDKRAENTRFNYWFQVINLLGPKSNVIVLENPINISAANQAFPHNKYSELFGELTISNYEVNLKKTRGKDSTKWKLFLEAVQEGVSSLEIVNRKVPRKWTLIRNELNLLNTRRYIAKDSFYKICEKPEIGLTKEQADLCLLYLTKLGDLVYFDDFGVSHIIFLDHNWLTQGIYHILEDSVIKERKGLFTRQQAFKLWDKYGYSESEKEMLLNLLSKDKFDICYELKGQKDQFITPLLLPDDKPEKWALETSLHFRYRYGFMPHGIFSRLIVRIHEKIDGEKRWVSGVRLIDEFDGVTVYAEVQQVTDPEHNQEVIDIRISGPREGCKRLLAFIRAEVERLHKDFRNLNYDEIVACNCDTCKELLSNGGKPSFYEFKELEDRVSNNKFFVDCKKTGYKEVSIGQILSDFTIESAAGNSRSHKLLEMIMESGMSLNNNTYNYSPKNELNITDVGNATATSNSRSSSSARSEAKNTLSVEIRNLLGEAEALKEDLEDERKLLEKQIDPEEVNVALKDIGKVESALGELEDAQSNDQEPQRKSKNRIKRFVEDLSNEESPLHKTLKVLRRGRDYGLSLAKSYNKIAESLGMPSIPSVALEVVEKI